MWASKMGADIDVEHAFTAIEDQVYEESDAGTGVQTSDQRRVAPELRVCAFGTPQNDALRNLHFDVWTPISPD
jgi:hypothetical protein